MSLDLPIPRATYRLQLNKDFAFRDAASLAPYLGALGVSHVYLSPILKARPGSTHGYDVVDHTMINPELGTLDAFRQMAGAFKAQGLGLIVDIVPNHMGIGGDQNPFWLDVLEWGKASPHADWFDINWSPPEPSLTDKILVPFLSKTYDQALADGALELRFNAATGGFDVWAEGYHRLPVARHTYDHILVQCSTTLAQLGRAFAALGEANRSEAIALKARLMALAQDPIHAAGIASAVARFNSPTGLPDLKALIGCQHWRPAHALTAADDINYRRFFIVSDLAGLRVEQDDVFDYVHKLTFALIAEGLIDGLRIDHIDGLYDPKAYCLKLRQKSPRPIYLVVEKILAPHEALRADWDVEGTTGYEFAAAVTRLLVDATAEPELDALYEEFTGQTEAPEVIARDAKLAIIDYEMHAELESLCDRLYWLARADPDLTDLSRDGIRTGLRQTLASLLVYRTYVDAGALAEMDRRNIGVALARARRAAPAIPPRVFDFLKAVMTGEAYAARPEMNQAARDCAQRIQQYSGPVMAKGLEDTALYRFNRLIAVSDVGSKPGRLSESVAAFHNFNAARLASLPHGMLLTSSHDSKRGEDGRARLAAISGFIEEWRQSVMEWRTILVDAGVPEIDANVLYYFFQTLVGSWPDAFGPAQQLDAKMLASFRLRVAEAMRKSIREARVHSNWITPNAAYEKKLDDLIAIALAPQSQFLAAFRRFEARMGLAGAQNGLIEAVLKLTSPGVPDIYQGAELWEQSMVDPDNRRAVDYAVRQTMLGEVEATGDLTPLLAHWRDGAIKLALMARCLDLRRSSPELFVHGSYEPLTVTGLDAHRMIAFMRCHGEEAVIIVCGLGPWCGSPNAAITLPNQWRWQDLLRRREIAGGPSAASEICGALSVAVLTAIQKTRRDRAA